MRSLLSNCQLIVLIFIFQENRFEKDTKKNNCLNCNGDYTRKVVSLSVLSYQTVIEIRVSKNFRSVLPSFYLPYLYLSILCYLCCFFLPSFFQLSFVPLSLFLRSLNPESYGIRLNEADIHNGFAIIRWRPRHFSFFFPSSFSFDSSLGKKYTCHHLATTLPCTWMPIDGPSSRECRGETSTQQFYSESVEGLEDSRLPINLKIEEKNVLIT